MTNASDLGFTAREVYHDPLVLYLSSQAESLGDPPHAQAEKERNYEPDFAGFDRSIIGRVPGNNDELGNNVPKRNNISLGKTQYWTLRKELLLGPKSAARTLLRFESDPRDQFRNEGIPGDVTVDDGSHNLLKRQDESQAGRMLYVSLAICDQPSWKDERSRTEDQPQLTVYISKSSDNTKPGSGRSDFSFKTFKGYGAIRVQASGDVFFGVEATEIPDLDGEYNYELAVSIDTLYAAYNSHNNSTANEREDFLVHVDSDSASALLIASNFTMEDPPYSIFVYHKDDNTVRDVERSLCGLQAHAQIKGNLFNGPSTSNVDTRVETLEEGQKKQQFYVKDLEPNSEYYAVLAVDGNSANDGGSVVGGGGTVGTPLSFRTKSGLLQLLSICPVVSY